MLRSSGSSGCLRLIDIRQVAIGRYAHSQSSQSVKSLPPPPTPAPSLRPARNGQPHQTLTTPALASQTSAVNVTGSPATPTTSQRRPGPPPTGPPPTSAGSTGSTLPRGRETTVDLHSPDRNRAKAWFDQRLQTQTASDTGWRRGSAESESPTQPRASQEPPPTSADPLALAVSCPLQVRPSRPRTHTSHTRSPSPWPPCQRSHRPHVPSPVAPLEGHSVRSLDLFRRDIRGLRPERLSSVHRSPTRLRQTRLGHRLSL